MATYKVLQDIEAEDKLLGPLTLRQFLYAAIVAVLGFINYKLAQVNILFAIPLLFPMILFAMLAAPFGHDQSSEIWLLAKIRFFLKPRKRIWDQDGIQELVTITVPKKVERNLTSKLSQSEVNSRLKALANTLDSRGWAVKNVDVSLFGQPSYFSAVQADSDRLLDIDSLPQEVPSYDVQAADDILDPTTNPTAQHLDAMIQQSQQSHRQAALNQVQPTAPGSNQSPAADYWFMNQPTQAPQPPPGYATFQSNPVVIPGSQDDPTAPTKVTDTGVNEQQLLEKLHEEQKHSNPAYSHLKTLQPIDDQQSANSNQQIANDNQQMASSASVNPDILRLANNDDLNVATIAREANRKKQTPPDDEVVISLR